MKQTQRYCVKSVLIAVLSLLSAGAPAGAAERKPNVIYILADDLGYGQLGCYGQTRGETPHLDQLAAEGMRFTQHYAGAPYCAPSRFTLMTGKHIGHAKTYSQNQRLAPDALTLPKLLKTAGYRTAAFGKWGLGDDPNHQGFDEWLGFIDQRAAHYHYPLKVWKNKEPLAFPENRGLRVEGKYKENYSNGTYIHDVFTDSALSFIKENKDTPFFIYLPYTIPHLEFIVPEDSLAQYEGRWPEKPYYAKKGKSKVLFYDGYGYCSNEKPRATYAAMISRMDRDVGRMVALLKELGLDENTLVIFSSDNGPAIGTGYDHEFFEGAGPLRSGKGSWYEGGLRVPMIARWPGKVAPGSITDHVSYFPDILPTIAELAGLEVPVEVDGLSMLPTLLGQEGQQDHTFLFWSCSVRMGDWKYVDPAKGKGNSKGQLFNLADDIAETTDLSGKYPEVVRQIEAIIDANELKNETSRNKKKSEKK